MPDAIRWCAILALALLPLACATARKPGATAELRFGARAAQHELWREAVLRFENAASARPGDAAALNDLAVAYEATGQLDRAEETYRSALAAAPADRHIKENLDRFRERRKGAVQASAGEK